MALNPISFFRKYQKFWMAAILLMCMITFVLCTGSQGDLGDAISKMFQNRDRGAEIAKIGGKSYYRKDMDDLKASRQIANDFMRKMCEKLKETADANLKKLKTEKNLDPKQKKMKEINNQMISQMFEDRLKRKPYFGGDVKLDDLVNFQIALNLADHLKIPQFDKEMVWKYMEFEFGQRDVTQYPYQTYVEVFLEVQRTWSGNRITNQKTVWDAIGREFRARDAMLAIVKSQPDMFELGKGKPPPFQQLAFRLRQGSSKYKYHDVRAPVTLGQLWSEFNEKRLEYDLVMVPVDVKDYVKDVKVNEDDLQAFFKKYRDKPYDPTLKEPGFKEPTRVKVEFVTADPRAPEYRDSAKLMAALEFYALPTMLPNAGFLNDMSFLAGPFAERKHYQIEYAKDVTRRLDPRFQQGVMQLLSSPITSTGHMDDILVYQGRESPAGVTALLGALVSPDSVFAALTAPAALENVAQYENGQWRFADGKWSYEDGHAKTPNFTFYSSQDDNLGLFKAEAKKRAPFFAALIGLAQDYPFAVAAAWDKASKTPDFLSYQSELPDFKYAQMKEKHVDDLAAAEVRSTMTKLRDLLTNPASKADGKKEAINRELRTAKEYLSFDRQVTKRFYDRYSIEGVKELEPLRESFRKYLTDVNLIEGRAGTPKALTDADFYKLFFDPSQSFSAAKGKYHVVAWPPVVSSSKGDLELQFRDREFVPGFDRDKILQAREPGSEGKVDFFKVTSQPFLFWISEREDAFVPERLATKAELDRDAKKLAEKVQEIEAKFKGKDAELTAALAELNAGDFAQKLRQERALYDRVLQAWQIDKARDKFALEDCKRIAKGLQAAADPWSEAQFLAKDHKHDAIRLKGIAPLVAAVRSDEGLVIYSTTYKLPSDTFLYPRDDMAQQLLMFGKPKAPLKIGSTALDEENERLFKAHAKEPKDKRLVQIFNNKPQDRFYVAVMTREPAANFDEFYEAFRKAVNFGVQPGPGEDTLVLELYDNLARDTYDSVMNGLRETMHVTISEDARKSFDESAARE